MNAAVLKPNGFVVRYYLMVVGLLVTLGLTLVLSIVTAHATAGTTAATSTHQMMQTIDPACPNPCTVFWTQL